MYSRKALKIFALTSFSMNKCNQFTAAAKARGARRWAECEPQYELLFPALPVRIFLPLLNFGPQNNIQKSIFTIYLY